MTAGVGQVCARWWRERLRADTGAARGLRARLRRAEGVVEVLSEPEVTGQGGLWPRIADATPGVAAVLKREPARLAALAGVLAAVEGDDRAPLARRLGAGETPAFSRLRFQRLLRLEEAEELAMALRRALPLAGQACHVARLAEDLVFWNEEVRARWCFEYFGASLPDRIRPEAETPGSHDKENVA